jgi:hypothetical protein
MSNKLPPAVSIFYDSKSKRYRDSKGRFVGNKQAEEYLFTHRNTYVRSKSGNYYRSHVIADRQRDQIIEEKIKSTTQNFERVDVNTLSFNVSDFFHFVSEYQYFGITNDQYALLEGYTKALARYVEKYQNKRFYFYSTYSGVKIETVQVPKKGKKGVTMQSVEVESELSGEYGTGHQESFSFIDLVGELIAGLNEAITLLGQSNAYVTQVSTFFCVKGWDYENY